MAVTPACLIPWVDRQWHDANGAPLIGGLIYTYEAGTSTPKATYTDHLLATPQTNPVVLDAEGRATIYLAAGGYKIVVHDVNDAELYSIDNVYDGVQTILANLAVRYSEGAKGESTDYQVVAGDRLVTVDGGNVWLPAAADWGEVLTVKNIGASPLLVVPDGTDTIDNVAASYSVDAAASPEYPCVMLASDGVSNWWILASHKV